MTIKTKRLINKIISTLLLGAAIAFNVIGIINAENFKVYQLYLNIGACLFAIVYLLFDFKKNARLFYKLFISFIILKEILALINMAVYETIDQWYAFALVLVCYTCPLILLLRQDLGKRCSIIIISIYVFVSLLCFIAGIAIMPITSADGKAIAIYNGTRFILAAVFFVLIFGKYLDKFERNTK